MEIRKQGTLTADHDALKLTKLRSRSMIETENLLYLWIKDCNNRRLQISLKGKQFKIKTLHDFVKSKLVDITDKEAKETFEASKGWWERFANPKNLGSVNLLA